MTGLATGIEDLDHVTAGLQQGDLIVLAGRPSTGKTALALQVSLHVAKAGNGVLVVSLEMSHQEILDRVLCWETGIDSLALRHATIGRSEVQRCDCAVKQLSDLKFWIADSATRSTSDILAQARQLEDDLRLVVIDYLQIIDEPASSSWSTNDRVAYAANRTKAMARSLDVPVLLISQVNRGAEANPKQGPELRHLRDSGVIEQVADIVMFLHSTEIPGTVCLTVKKHRNGPLAKTMLTFVRSTGRFLPVAS